MKAVLEIEMPKDCNNCPLSIKICYEESSVYFDMCVPLNKEIKYLTGSVKLNNCPLKPIKE